MPTHEDLPLKPRFLPLRCSGYVGVAGGDRRARRSRIAGGGELARPGRSDGHECPWAACLA